MSKRSVKSLCGGAQAPYGLWMGNSRSGNHHPVKSHSFVLWLAARACALMQRKVLKTEWIEKRWAVIRMYGFTKLPLSTWDKQLSIQSGGRIRYESWRPRYMDVYGLPRRKLCARSASVISNYINTHQTLIGILVSIIICTIMSTFFFCYSSFQ